MKKGLLVMAVLVLLAGCARVPEVLLDIMWGDAKVHVEQGQEEKK